MDLSDNFDICVDSSAIYRKTIVCKVNIASIDVYVNVEVPDIVCGSSLGAPSETDPSLIGGEDPPLDFGGKGRNTE